MKTKNISRKEFIRISVLGGFSLKFSVLNEKFFADPPLSPNNDGKSILPTVLEVGDIIISTTSSLQSRVINFITGYPVSHAMIVYDVSKNSNPEIMESVRDGVRITTYNEMMKDSSFAVALRKPKLKNTDKKKIKEWLLTKIGVDYDYGAVIKDFLSVKFNLNNKKYSLDIGYKNDAEDNNKYYCSELVFQAYKEIGVDLIKFDEWNRLPERFILMNSFGTLDYIGHLNYKK